MLPSCESLLIQRRNRTEQCVVYLGGSSVSLIALQSHASRLSIHCIGRRQVSLLWNYTPLVWWWSSVRCNHINVLHTLSLMQLIKNQDAFFKKWKRPFSVSKTHALSHKCAIAIPLIHWVQAKQGKAKQSKAKQSSGGSNPDYSLCLHCTTPCTVFIMQSNVIPILSRAKLFCCSSGFTFTWPTPTSTIYIPSYTPFTWPTPTPTPAWPSPMAHSYSCNMYMHKTAHQEITKHNMKYKSQN